MCQYVKSNSEDGHEDGLVRFRQSSFIPTPGFCISTIRGQRCRKFSCISAARVAKNFLGQGGEA